MGGFCKKLKNFFTNVDMIIKPSTKPIPKPIPLYNLFTNFLPLTTTFFTTFLPLTTTFLPLTMSSQHEFLNTVQDHKIDIEYYENSAGEDYYHELNSCNYYEEMPKRDLIQKIYDREAEIENIYKELKKCKSDLSFLRHNSMQQCLYCLDWIRNNELNTLIGTVTCCNDCLKTTTIVCTECRSSCHNSKLKDPLSNFCSDACMSKWKCIDICAGSGDTECVCRYDLGKSYVHDNEWIKL